MQNKRGDISTSTIVYVILGIAALVVLIVALTGGFGKLTPWIQKDNVDSIVTQCSVACSTLSQFDFCTKTMELTSSEVGNIQQGKKTAVGTCFALAKDPRFENFGIEECPAITCPTDTVEVVGTFK